MGEIGDEVQLLSLLSATLERTGKEDIQSVEILENKDLPKEPPCRHRQGVFDGLQNVTQVCYCTTGGSTKKTGMRYSHLLQIMAYGRPTDMYDPYGQNMFIFGEAGTGKSWLIKELQKKSTDILYAAPSGIAALNIQGLTLHSLFCLQQVTPQPPSFDTPLNEHKERLLQKAHTLLIDEISMVSCDLLDKVDIVLRKVRQNETPFGGIRMIFVGDIFQLHPFITSEQLPLMKKLYPDNGNHFNFYNSKVFSYFYKCKLFSKDALELSVYYLTHNYRHCEDPLFGQALSTIRANRPTKEDLELINHQVLGKAEFEQFSSSDSCVLLTTTNEIADYINNQRMEELPDTKYRSYAAFNISPLPEKWRYPMKDVLSIKVGMKIMFVMNDSQINGRRWVNGTAGRVIGKTFNQDQELISVTVVIDSDSNEKKYEVTRESYNIYEAFYNPKTDTVESRFAGTVVQFPFAAGWAITIHKSQSLTLAKAGIALGARAFAEGQVYVALSRVKARNDFFLNRPIRRDDIKVSSETMRFYQEFLYHKTMFVFDENEILPTSQEMVQRMFWRDSRAEKAAHYEKYREEYRRRHPDTGGS
jgi:hypothetical protein